MTPKYLKLFLRCKVTRLSVQSIALFLVSACSLILSLVQTVHAEGDIVYMCYVDPPGGSVDTVQICFNTDTVPEPLDPNLELGVYCEHMFSNGTLVATMSGLYITDHTVYSYGHGLGGGGVIDSNYSPSRWIYGGSREEIGFCVPTEAPPKPCDCYPEN